VNLRTLAAIAAASLLFAGQATPPSRDAILAAARQVIGEARYATFVTIDTAGQPHARIVDPFPPEEDFAIWIGTHAATRKLAHIASERRVTLLYFDPPRQHYVSVHGTAAAVRDRGEKTRRFKSEWKAFYANGPAGDDYVLITITPTRLEVVAESLGMTNDPATWRPVTLDLKP
jgi:general stress protein 26